VTDAVLGPLRRRDVLLALAATVLVVGAALASDPLVRSTFVAAPEVRQPECAGVAVDVATSDPAGRLTVPEGGLAVRVHRGGADVPSHLELQRREAGGEWGFAWQLDAPSGREVFYVATVRAGTEVQVLAFPTEGPSCVARSPVVAAPA
jgi:hypothetical protein